MRNENVGTYPKRWPQIAQRVAWHQTWPFPHTPWMQKHWDRYVRELEREARRAALRTKTSEHQEALTP